MPLLSIPVICVMMTEPEEGEEELSFSFSFFLFSEIKLNARNGRLVGVQILNYFELFSSFSWC